MSTSPSRPAPPTPAPQSAPVSVPAPEAAPDILPFPYCEIAKGAGAGPGSRDLTLAGLHFGGAASEADEVAEREKRARELGRQEGEAAARKNFDEQLTRDRTALTAALTQFSRERGAYYQKVEAEVVQLALSIARKIMHREAQVDPLLLAGIVRVALEKIEGAAGVVLFAPPQRVEEWRRYLAQHMEPGDLPEIIEDPALEPDRCILQTSMGKADLGVEVQLKEIEQGLMDLLAARPGEKA
jgi:flagellar assembly protein FliH